MPQLPSGTVTFVFSDIEGSTSLLKQLGDADYAELVKMHRRLMREIFDARQGQEIDTQGDAFFYSFPRARDAVAAAVEVQRAHQQQKWPGGVAVRVRLGLHTGEPAVGDDGYTGLDVVRASRIAAVGHGGQILLSETTRAIVAHDLPDGVSLHSLGEQRLRDIDQPEPLHELQISDAPVPPPPAKVAGLTVAGLSEAAGALGKPFVDRTSQLIEQRVLASLEEAFKADREEEEAKRKAKAENRRKKSVADEIARLHDLHEGGALTDEQYARAVDRALADRD